MIGAMPKIDGAKEKEQGRIVAKYWALQFGTDRYNAPEHNDSVSRAMKAGGFKYRADFDLIAMRELGQLTARQLRIQDWAIAIQDEMRAPQDPEELERMQRDGCFGSKTAQRWLLDRGYAYKVPVMKDGTVLAEDHFPDEPKPRNYRRFARLQY